MFNKNLMRDPIIRKKVNKQIDSNIPDLAYEISEQSLENESGGTSPVCATICLSAYTISIVSGIVTAATSKTDPFNPEDDDFCGPNGK